MTKKNKRALFGFLGKASKFLFGTATTGDLQNIWGHVYDLEHFQNGQQGNNKHLKDDLVQLVNITNERLTNLRQRTDDQTNKINEIIQTMTKLQIMTEIDRLHADNMQLDLNRKTEVFLISW